MEKQLAFNASGNLYVAEVQVSADYNIHIEMEGKGTIEVFQRGCSQGEYRRAYIESKWGRVIDADFCHAVYPKYIRIAVTSKVVKAFITEAQS